MTKLDQKTVLIMAGGTGGHIMPGIAVAEVLLAQGMKCVWLGRSTGIEANILANYPKIKYYSIATTALRGKSWRNKLKLPWIFLSALIQSWRVLRRVKPDVVCGFGGYVSAPGGIAAWLSRTPLVVHEQNRIPGLTNRILAKFADTVCESFVGTFPSSKKVICTGNPVRHAIASIELPEKRFVSENETIKIAVLGGSQGAKALNQIVPEGITQFAKSHAVAVWHQTGQTMQTEVQARYQQLGLKARADAFITSMAEFYTWADVVIARSGATTVAEIACAGVASILIPYPYAVDDHQTANAKVLVSAGGATLLPQNTLSPDLLADLLRSLQSSKKRLEMAKFARNVSHPMASETLSHVLNKSILIKK